MVRSKWIQIISAGLLLTSSCTNVTSGSEQQTLIDFCLLKSADVDSVATAIIKEKQKVTGAMKTANDDCLLGVIDNLSKKCSVKSFQALEVISSGSDGYVSEALMDITVSILENSPDKFVDYLSSSERSPLLESLVDGLSMKCSVEKINPSDLKSKFIQTLTTDIQKSTLDEIFQKVDPKKFD